MADQKTILVAEDDKFLSKVYLVKLKNAGYNIISAADGETASSMIKESKPDLILLDLMMPKKTGFDVLAEAKADPETKDIPVLILSNLSQESDKKKVLEAGAKEHIVKANISIEDILKKIKNYL